MNLEVILEKLYRFYNVSPTKGGSNDFQAEISRKLIKAANNDKSRLLEQMIEELNDNFSYVKNYTKRQELSCKVSMHLESWNEEKYQINFFISKILDYYTYSLEPLKESNTVDVLGSVQNDVMYLIFKYKDEVGEVLTIDPQRRRDFFKSESNRNEFVRKLENIVHKYGQEVGISLLDFKISGLYDQLTNFTEKELSRQTWTNVDRALDTEISKAISVICKYYPFEYLPEDILSTPIHMDDYTKQVKIYNLLF